MAFPVTPLPVVVEIYLGAVLGWVDITAYVFTRDGGITIRRGFPDEGTTPEPSSMTMTLDNRTGRFTPRNPMGPYYGVIGRNTPVRVRVTGGVAGPAYLHCEGTSTLAFPNNFSDAFVLNDSTAVTDLDVQVDARVFGWRSGNPIAAKYDVSAARSWALMVDADGFLALAWSTDGTSGGVLSATSTVVAGLVDGERKALRATLDVDNGAAGKTVTFYTADTMAGPWVQLGAAVTTAGTTSIFTATASIQVGHHESFSVPVPTLYIYAAKVLNGIGGTPVVDVDFSTVASGATSFTDDAGRTWTIATALNVGEVRVVDPGIRFVGEVSEWPPRWDVSGNDVWTSVTAQGVLRRLNQGKRPARSPVRSATENQAFGTVGYWHLEDGGGTSFAPYESGATAGGAAQRMTYSGAAPDLAASGPFLGSDSVAVLGSTTALTGVPAREVFDGFGVGLHLDVPASNGWADNTPILWIEQLIAGSTVATWEVRYKSGSGGDLEVRALNGSGTQLDTSGTLDFNIDGKSLRLTVGFDNFSLSESSWDVTVRALSDDGASIVEAAAGNTFAGLVTTHASRVRIAPIGGLPGLGVGHVTLFGGFAVDAFVVTDEVLLSSLGETAAARAKRLIDDAGVESRLAGTTSATEDDEPRTVAMGAQATPSTLLDALNETWVADQSLLFETRDTLGLTFRALWPLYNRPRALTLDYTGAGEIAPDLEPTDDDQQVRNDVTVNQTNGTSARQTDSTSRNGTGEPPDGVGPYEDNPTVNVLDVAILIHIAGWIVHVRTWDESRFPRVVVNMAALALASKTDLIADLCAMDLGDRTRLQNLPLHSGAVGDVDLMMLGYTETINHPNTWVVEGNYRPYGPYQVGVLAEDSGDTDTNVGRRAEDENAAIRAAIDSDDLSIAFDPNVFRWTTDADDFDPDLRVNLVHKSGVDGGGELVEVSSIATTAATFVAAGGADHDDNAAVTPADYAGGAVADWVVVYAGERDSTASLSISDPGYTYTELVQSGGIYLWAAIRTASTPAPTVTPSGGGAGDTVSAVVLGLRNMPITLGLDEYVLDSQYLSNSSAQNIDYPTMVAAHWPGRVILLLARKSDDWTTGVAPPSGFTEAVDTSSASGDDQGIAVYYRIDTTPTRVPNGSLTVTGGSTAVSEAMVVALAGGFQTLTVSSRAVNGITKAHSAGTRLAAAGPLVLAL